MSAEGQRFGRTQGRAPITRVETPLGVYYLDPVDGPWTHVTEPDCGHWKCYAVMADPKGAHISCLYCRATQAEADLATLRAEHAKCWKLPPPDTDPVLEAALADAVRLRAGIAALERTVRWRSNAASGLAGRDTLIEWADRLAALRDGRG